MCLLFSSPDLAVCFLMTLNLVASPSFFSFLFFFLLCSHQQGRSVVLAGVRIIDLLTDATLRLVALEDRVFGPGAVLSVTSVPTAVSSPGSVPGRLGLDETGNVWVEPLVGKAVMVAGHDVLLELHRIAARLNRTEAAMAACACLAPPATCHPVQHHPSPPHPNQIKIPKKTEVKKYD
jgi:hypothetical protein